LVIDKDGRVLGLGRRPLPQYYPHEGWVEHDAEEIWQGQMHAAQEALNQAGRSGADLAAIGVANQRETALLWDAQTGIPLSNAIVWQCRRTSARCRRLQAEGHETYVRERTGLRLDPYFSAGKLEWLLAHCAEAPALLRRGRLRAGTVDSFLVWRLTGGRTHVTDFSNASRTMLFDIHRLDWDPALLKLFGIPAGILPRPVPSAGVAGYSDRALFGAEVPIAGICGDQQAALFGQACFAPGQAKITYGTGCFLLLNVGRQPVVSTHGLVGTVAWGLGPGRENISYALEGSVFIAGAAIQWLRDGLGLIDSAADIGPLAATVTDTGDVHFVPALTGLGAPFWDPAARGLLIGLTQGTSRAHIARATEEAICYQTRAVLEAMIEDAGMRPTTLKVDGGASADDFLLQLQADTLRLPVQRQQTREATALGAAALAGVGVGLWSLDDVARMARDDRVFTPRAADPALEKSYERWLRAVARTREWAHE
jgi:glycerol kinase